MIDDQRLPNDLRVLVFSILAIGLRHCVTGRGAGNGTLSTVSLAHVRMA